MKKHIPLVVLALAACAIALGQSRPHDERGVVAAVLDDLHDAASKADGPRYFSLFAPDAVFFGTDAGEPMKEAWVKYQVY